MIKALENIQQQITDLKTTNPDISLGELNDTYHSFKNLYQHRTVLFALLCMRIPYAWKSKTHEDGTMFDGMFIAGFPTPDGMITYHCDNEYWNLFKIPTLPHGPHFDGYTEKDVLDRLEKFIMNSGTNIMNSDNIAKIEKIVEEEILPTFGEDKVSMAAYIGFYNL